MRLKAVRDLVQKSDIELFAELERGLRLCHENAERTMSDVAILSDLKRHRAATILQNVANEEAAKALILLDVVRCPRGATEERNRQFKYFINHLPKGIYASVCDIRPCSFSEVRRWVDLQRKAFYLDGPTGTDWIYANMITTSREQAMYVDYVYAEGNYWWHNPEDYDADLYSARSFQLSSAMRLTTALHALGVFSAAALAVVAEIWRSVPINDSLSIHDLRKINGTTLDKLNEKGLLTTTDKKALELVFHEWIFPLYPLDLSVDENKTEVEAARGSGYEN